MWTQHYQLFSLGLGWSAVLSVTPLLILLLVLGALRKPAWIAALCGLAAAIALAAAGYRMPFPMIASAAAEGLAFGLFPISWIVFWALVLFRITEESGKFEVVRSSLAALTSDPRLQSLLVAFAFGAFLEGAAGFGAPVAIAASMLTGLGFSPFRAAVLCLIANTAPVAFGSIGIPVIVLSGTTGLPIGQLSATIGRLITPFAFILPAYMLLSAGGVEAFSGIVLPALVASTVFAGVQLAVSVYLGPQLTDILAAIAAIICLLIFCRWEKFRRPRKLKMDFATGLPTPLDEQQTLNSESVAAPAVQIENNAHPASAKALGMSEILYAWSPFGILIACILLWGAAPFQALLSRWTYVLHWPVLYGAVSLAPPIAAVPTPFPATFNLNWASAPGTACMVATLLSAIVLRVKATAFLRAIRTVMRQLALPTVAVTAVLATAFVMNFSGATETLGLTLVATGKWFPLFSSLLGWFGVFLTGSDTSSNALFGNLQVITARRLGIDPVLIAASNSVGGVMGKMISLQTIAVATAATRMPVSQQPLLFRFTFRHSVVLALAVGLVAMLFAYVL